MSGPPLFFIEDRYRVRGMSDGAYHCHLKKGKPTYVCFWKILDKRERIVEVFYVGSHEKAPYPG
jgi:hypothetical protein